MNFEVTDAEIDKVFQNTSFGIHVNTTDEKRKYLAEAVLKTAMDYHSGFTITQIMKELGLILKSGSLSKKGRVFLRILYTDLKYKP